MKNKTFRVKVDVGRGLFEKVFRVSAKNETEAKEKAQDRAMKTFPKNVIGATALGATVKICVLGGIDR